MLCPWRSTLAQKKWMTLTHPTSSYFVHANKHTLHPSFGCRWPPARLSPTCAAGLPCTAGDTYTRVCISRTALLASCVSCLANPHSPCADLDQACNLPRQPCELGSSPHALCPTLFLFFGPVDHYMLLQISSQNHLCAIGLQNQFRFCHPRHFQHISFFFKMVTMPSSSSSTSELTWSAMAVAGKGALSCSQATVVGLELDRSSRWSNRACRTGATCARTSHNGGKAELARSRNPRQRDGARPRLS
jgi:hypothetical protein